MTQLVSELTPQYPPPTVKLIRIHNILKTMKEQVRISFIPGLITFLVFHTVTPRWETASKPQL